MTQEEKDQLKLLIKKAVFTGNSFVNHLQTVEDVSDKYSTEQLIQLADEDEEFYNLLGTLELIHNQLVGENEEE